MRAPFVIWYVDIEERIGAICVVRSSQACQLYGFVPMESWLRPEDACCWKVCSAIPILWDSTII